MKKFITTIITQFETFNITGINEIGLYHVIEAYIKGDAELRLGGKTFPFRGIEEFIIHAFESDEALNKFLDYVTTNKLRKKSMTGREYFEVKYIEKYGINVTM